MTAAGGVTGAARTVGNQLRHAAEAGDRWAEHVAQHPIVVQRSLPGGSNATLLVDVGGEAGVYKPAQGARRLYDYDVSTLHLNETAFYKLAQALGPRWDHVPPTTVVANGPQGVGSLQKFVNVVPGRDLEYFRQQARYNPSGPEADFLRAMTLLDDIANSGDRKGIHVMGDAAGKGWLIDHGLAFHTEDKLKSAFWDYAGQPVPNGYINDLARVAAELRNPRSELRETLGELLYPDSIVRGDKINALIARMDKRIAAKTFPNVPAGRNAYPYAR